MTKEIAPKDATINDFQRLFPPLDDESTLVLGCMRGHYSASRIAHAVEDCNAHLLNLNVTSTPSDLADIVVEIRVNHRNAEAISRSLQRYGYDILEAKSNHAEDNERLRSRANELLRYLEV